MSKKVTMQDIANIVGVSKVSVSKAMNNQPGISDKLREQILSVAENLGYAKAVNDNNKEDYQLAFICPKRFFLEDETFYTTIYYYLNKTCMEKGYTVTCFVISDYLETNCIIPTQLATVNFDGIFIAGELRDKYLSKIVKLKGEKIAIDFYKFGASMDSIIVDNYDTSFKVTRYLIDRGHKEIGFVGNISHTSSICDRYFGYAKAMRLNHLPIIDDWHIQDINSLTGEYTQNFRLPSKMPTAFVCHCDKAAFTLMQKLEKNGMKVPEQVSLISFDNTSICDLTTPKLTSVDIDRKQLALYSLNQMIYRLTHPSSSPHKLYLGSTLVERGSVRPLV
ncbi:MAG TPA: hypothetical protein DIW17_00230 [Clostridiales bacterium]|nr:hypothetical protein [Clostridiales bacterium]